MRTEQARVWRDYKAWRSRLGDLARLHDHRGGALFPRWAYSLRYWAGPGAALFILLPALLAAWSARNRYRPARTRPGKAPRGARPEAVGPAGAMSRFEDAVKQVARISQEQAKRQEAAAARPARPEATAPAVPPTDAVPVDRFISTEPPKAPKRKEPETVPLPVEPVPGAPGDTGRETRFFQVGPGWGHPPGDPRIPKPDLSMEDEDASKGNAEETLGVMPPTTEVERVERRKEEVLKLARKGLTSSEISRRLRISQDQVEFIIRLRREKG